MTDIDDLPLGQGDLLISTLAYEFSEEYALHASWYTAMTEAELEGREFTVFNHPLLPGWQLHVNQKEEFKEFKPDVNDPPPPSPQVLRYYARRRAISR